ncbi:hypothetical protein ACFOLK_08870 [Marinococcus halophilus]|uniref:Uncharacterized protein n=1 Tax=Marinococcus halophilus TaxID=1371 RepID=A0A510Y797_MARHA|nr:hypothetical protein [Marinococcus halophilus]GEK58327.1 hypothetical protein MHA01_12320 [Marinococcus halophilus]
MVPACGVVMQGRRLNEAEEQLRMERVQRNLERFKEAERKFKRQKLVAEG